MLPIFLKGMPPQFTLKYGLKKQKFNGTDGTIFFRVLTIDLDTYKNFKSLISEINTEKQQGTSMLTHICYTCRKSIMCKSDKVIICNEKGANNDLCYGGGMRREEE